MIEETVWLGDIPVATLRPHTGGGVDLFYVHTDQLNTPRAVTRPSDNTLMWTWYSDPFGTDAANENPAGAGTFKYNLRFAGQLFDGQAGLHANGLRDCYDPAVGRYCEPDPIGLGGGSLSPYAYVGGNPISRIDPLGLFVPGFWGTVGGATAGGATEGAEAGAEAGTVAEPGGGTVAGGVVGAVVGGVIGAGVGIYEACKDQPCPPCKTVSGKIVPIGTIAFRPMESPPPGTVEHGIEGPHFNLYKANQAPRNSPQPCKCFWQPIRAVPAAALPPNAIPIEPFAP